MKKLPFLLAAFVPLSLAGCGSREEGIRLQLELSHQASGAATTDGPTRIFTTDIEQWQEIGRAHGEFFRDIRPAATMVEIRRLISPDLLVEIEADAILLD